MGPHLELRVGDERATCTALAVPSFAELDVWCDDDPSCAPAELGCLLGESVAGDDAAVVALY